MERIEPGKYVELGYDLYEVSADGSQKLVHQTDSRDPEKIVFGVTPGVIVPLAKAIEGLLPGGAFDLVVKCDEAFGKHDPEQVVELDREIFVVDGKFDPDGNIRKGAWVPMMTAEGYRINGLVTEISDEKVVMDFNHPLAGKDIRFAGKIVTVRDATEEELRPSKGCGCHDPHCGCDEDCGCDDPHCGGCH